MHLGQLSPPKTYLCIYALEWEGGLRPVIIEEICTGCALCSEACIVEPKAVEVSALIAEEEAADVQ